MIKLNQSKQTQKESLTFKSPAILIIELKMVLQTKYEAKQVVLPDVPRKILHITRIANIKFLGNNY